MEALSSQGRWVPVGISHHECFIKACRKRSLFWNLLSATRLITPAPPTIKSLLASIESAGQRTPSHRQRPLLLSYPVGSEDITGLSRGEGLTKVWVPGAGSREAILEFCPQRGRGGVSGAGNLNSVRKNVLQEPNELVNQHTFGDVCAKVVGTGGH